MIPELHAIVLQQCGTDYQSMWTNESIRDAIVCPLFNTIGSGILSLLLWLFLTTALYVYGQGILLPVAATILLAPMMIAFVPGVGLQVMAPILLVAGAITALRLYVEYSE